MPYSTGLAQRRARRAGVGLKIRRGVAVEGSRLISKSRPLIHSLTGTDERFNRRGVRFETADALQSYLELITQTARPFRICASQTGYGFRFTSGDGCASENDQRPGQGTRARRNPAV